MNTSIDRDIVDSWLEPVSYRDTLLALRDAGFSGDVYRSCFADLNATLEDDDAGTLHFLRHGYAEGRIFRTGLDLAGLNRLQQLPVRNRIYLQNVLVALVTAWSGANIHSAADLVAHRPMIEQLRAMGGVPLVVLGDASSGFYRRGVSSGERWICPLAMTPLEGGIEALLRIPSQATISSQPDFDQDTLPTIWKFGQFEVQTGYLAYRLRLDIKPGETDAFLDFASSVIDSYMKYLDKAVQIEDRRRHWIAGVFPPVRQAVGHEPAAPALIAEFGVDVHDLIARLGFDTLHDRMAMHQRFNAALEQKAIELGFSIVHDFDALLAAHGVVDRHYLPMMPDSDELDYLATRGIFSTSIWNIVDDKTASTASGGIRERFEHLLEEIRIVQMGEAG